MNIAKLMEARDKASKSYRDLIKGLEKENREANADERAKMDNMVAEIDSLDAQIREAQGAQEARMDELEGYLKELRIDSIEVPEAPQVDDAADFRSYMMSGSIAPSMEERAMTTGTGSTGGYLVPDKFYNELKEYQADVCPIYNLATKTVWDADAVFPVVSAFGATTLVAEGSAKTGVTPTIAQTSLTGYQLMYMVDVPQTLLRKSAFNIDEKLAGWWAKSFSSVAEDYFAEGTGTGQPTGLAAAATAGTDSAANNAIAGDDIINWYYDLDPAYRKKASWIFADSTIALIRKMKNTVTTSGALNYLWMPGMAGQPDTLLGRPIYASDGFSDLTAGAACGVFGDISEFQIVEFGKPALLRDPYTVANYGQVRFVGYRLVDCDLPVAEAVITCAIAS